MPSPLLILIINTMRLPVLTMLVSATTLAHGQTGNPGFFLDDWQPKTTEAPAYTQNDKPTASSSTVVTVEAGQLIRKVSPYIFGNNAAIYQGDYDSGLTGKIAELNVGTIRYPGGDITNEFFWDASGSCYGNTSGFPSDAQIHPLKFDMGGGNVLEGCLRGGYEQGSASLDLDEYYQLLEATNSTGIICANYGYARYGTSSDPVTTAAEYAADWVTQANGRAKFWEVGNENMGPHSAGYQVKNPKNGAPQFNTGSNYGKDFKVFADKMRAADPNIKIGAVAFEVDDVSGSWNPHNQLPGWNSGLMSQVGDKADYMIIHHYFTPFEANSGRAEILNSYTNVQGIISKVVRDLQSAGLGNIPIALTEWNINADGNNQKVSHVNGMHTSLVLGQMIEHGMGLATQWNFVNHWAGGNDHGMFSHQEPNITQRTPHPTFYNYYYWAKCFGDRMVKSNVSGSKDIITYASTFSSGQVGLVVINKGGGDQTVSVNVNNFNPGNRYYWYSLEGDGSEFSRKIFVNGTGPSGVAGGPSDYKNIKAYSNLTAGGIKLRAKAYSVNFLILDGEGSGEWVDPCEEGVEIPTTGAVRIEAEDYCDMSGVQTENTSDEGGGVNIGWIDQGDWFEYTVNAPGDGTYLLDFRNASSTTDGIVEVYVDEQLEQTMELTSTGGWQSWRTDQVALALTAGVHTIKFEATKAPFNVNWFELTAAQIVLTEDQLISEYGVSLYPNPTNDWVTISGERLPLGTEISIYDPVGRRVITQHLSANRTYVDFDMSAMTNGLYLVVITTRDGVLTQRLSKQ